MMVTLTARARCGLCGFIRRGFMFPEMRINKRSMRSHGVHLVMFKDRCDECGTISGTRPLGLVWILDPESAEKVRVYRLRRWPELAQEAA